MYGLSQLKDLIFLRNDGKYFMRNETCNQGEDNKLVPSYVLWRFVKYAVVLINDKFCGNIRILTAMMLGCT